MAVMMTFQRAGAVPMATRDSPEMPAPHLGDKPVATIFN